MNQLVTVATFTYVQELFIARSRLESEGIPVFAQDSLTIQIDPLYSNALGGIKLQVRAEDAAEAMAILMDGGFEQALTGNPAGWLPEEAGRHVSVSEPSGLGRTNRWVIIIGLLVLAVIACLAILIG